MFSDFFSDFQDFLTSLDMIQTLALVNLIVLLIVIISIYDIFIIFLSDYYFKLLDLDTRFPKLAFFIQAQKRLTKFSLYVYTIILCLVLLYGLVVNSLIIV
jgi:hypothetical protein